MNTSLCNSYTRQTISPSNGSYRYIQYIPRNMHTAFALLCFVVVIQWLIFPYPSGLLHLHCGNLTIAPVPAKQPWWIWINTSCEFKRLHNHYKAKHNKTVCIFLGIYCTVIDTSRHCVSPDDRAPIDCRLSIFSHFVKQKLTKTPENTCLRHTPSAFSIHALPIS